MIPNKLLPCWMEVWLSRTLLKTWVPILILLGKCLRFSWLGFPNLPWDCCTKWNEIVHAHRSIKRGHQENGVNLLIQSSSNSVPGNEASDNNLHCEQRPVLWGTYFCVPYLAQVYWANVCVSAMYDTLCMGGGWHRDVWYGSLLSRRSHSVRAVVLNKGWFCPRLGLFGQLNSLLSLTKHL